MMVPVGRGAQLDDAVSATRVTAKQAADHGWMTAAMLGRRWELPTGSGAAVAPAAEHFDDADVGDRESNHVAADRRVALPQHDVVAEHGRRASRHR